MDKRSMIDGQDYVYYGAPYGYEEIYQASYGPAQANARYYQYNNMAAVPYAIEPVDAGSVEMIAPPKDEIQIAASSKEPVELGNITMAPPGVLSNKVVEDPVANWKPPNITYPEITDLKVDEKTKSALFNFYKIGPNRRRQAAHGAEVPKKRYPQLIIVGAKKCGTTALKVFMNYHPGLRDTPGERHFFNRPSNWKLGFKWYLDQMPLSYSDEVTYEKTPDYFDRPFVPERMAQMNDSVKIISILCDPVHRAYSHFLHAFAVQDAFINYT